MVRGTMQSCAQEKLDPTSTVGGISGGHKIVMTINKEVSYSGTTDKHSS